MESVKTYNVYRICNPCFLKALDVPYPKEERMKLKCNLLPIDTYSTLADLPPGVVAVVNFGGYDYIRWRDSCNSVYGIEKGFPTLTNYRASDESSIPKLSKYKVLKVLGKIEMKFEE